MLRRVLFLLGILLVFAHCKSGDDDSEDTSDAGKGGRGGATAGMAGKSGMAGKPHVAGGEGGEGAESPAGGVGPSEGGEAGEPAHGTSGEAGNGATGATGATGGEGGEGGVTPPPPASIDEDDAALTVGELEFIDPHRVLKDLDVEVENITHDVSGSLGAWSIKPRGRLSNVVYVRAPLVSPAEPGSALDVWRQDSNGNFIEAKARVISSGLKAVFALDTFGRHALKYQRTATAKPTGCPVLLDGGFDKVIAQCPTEAAACAEEAVRIANLGAHPSCENVQFGLSCGDDATTTESLINNCTACATRKICPPRNQADAVGDPHLKTFDGLLYDMQGVGELTLVKDPSDHLEVQVRTAPWTASTNVAVNTAVAMRVGENRISAYRDGTLRIDGETQELPDGLEALSGGGELWKTGSSYVVIWPDNSQVHFTLGGTFLSVHVFMPDERAAGDVTGLLADFERDGAGELKSRTGVAIASPTPFLSFYRVYVESWRVAQEDSLFDYEEGEDTETFTDRNFPLNVALRSQLTSEAEDTAETICTTAHVTTEWTDACVLDVGTTGDASFAVDLAYASKPTATLLVDQPVDCPPTDHVCVSGSAYVVDCDNAQTLVEACPTEAPCKGGFCIAATAAALRGLVKDATTNLPLEGATVIITHDAIAMAALTTGDTGLYSIELDPGTYELIVSAPGYLEARITVELVAGEVTTVTGLRQVPRGETADDGGVSGTITDSQSAVGAVGLTVDLRRGINATTGTIVATTTTDASGQYLIDDLRPGNYTLTASGTGYADAIFDVVVIAGQVKGSQNGSINRILLPGQMRIVLSWGTLPNDLDSHLYTPSINGTTYHLYYSSKGSTTAAPYAGLDVDDVSGSGPETFTITQLFPGTYTYRVYNFTGSPDILTSEARVDVYTANGLERSYPIPSTGSGRWWDVFTIDGATGALTGVGTISAQ